MKILLTVLSISVSFLASGQLVISSGTTFSSAPGTTIATTSGITSQSANVDLKDATIILAGNTPQVITNGVNAPLVVGGLTIDNTAGYTVKGNWNVANDLVFANGKLLTTKTNQLTYLGSTDLTSNSDESSYVIGPLSVQGQTGVRTFPIGSSSGYFPAQLLNVEATDAVNPLSFEVITADPGFTRSPGIKEVFTGHFWELTAGGSASTISSKTQISLSGNQAAFTVDGDVTILEREQGGAQNELGGSTNNTFFASNLNIAPTGKNYALAKSDVITVKVHKLITPDNDQSNDVLVIEGIDSFPENEVMLIDRWGVPFKSWKGFVNYTQPATSAQDIDYSKLAIGNYICVVKYTERGVSKSIKQMISVLK